MQKEKESVVQEQELVIGWREWASLPELGILKIKVKVDTGARTSSLHAFDVEEFKQGGKTYVRFKVHPEQKSNRSTIKAEAELIEKRKVKDSGGKVTIRPVIRVQIQIGSWTWPIEITLISRDEMGFRMLLGRQALMSMFLVNPARSFLHKKKKRLAL